MSGCAPLLKAAAEPSAGDSIVLAELLALRTVLLGSSIRTERMAMP
jgi:hypothetical protein